MDSLVIAVLLPLAQATESAPQSGEIGKQILKNLAAGESLPMILLSVLISVAVQLLAYWIAAKVVVGDPKGSFGNALKVWLLYLVVGFGIGMLVGVLVPILAMANNTTGVLGVLGGSLLLFIALIFLLPMKIFEIGFLRALGFFVLAVVLILAAQAGILRAQGKPALGYLPQLIEMARSPEKRDQLFKQMVAARGGGGLDGELDRLATEAERAKPFPERQDNLRKVYDALEARQKTLPPGDTKALADYERLRARYEELVRVLKADFAASKTQPPK